MSNGYQIGCTGQITWGAACNPMGTGCQTSDPANGCDHSTSGCSNCGMASFIVFKPASDPPDPAYHTILCLTKAGAIVCAPGPTHYIKGTLLTEINGEFPTPAVIAGLNRAEVTEIRVTAFSPKTAVVAQDVFSRSI